MTVRNFNGTSDSLLLLPGALGSATLGPYTVAVLMKPMANADKGILDIGASVTTSSNNFNNGKFTLWQGNGSSSGLHVETTSVGSSVSTLFGTADGWSLVVVTKASGSVAPRIHKYPLSTATWTRANAANAMVDQTMVSTDRLAFGKDESTNRNAMRLAASAIWTVGMSDAQVSALATNLWTGDWYNHAAGTPVTLWQFNQGSTAVAVADLTGGGATETAISGTTVVTGDDPPGWTFGIVPSSGTTFGDGTFGDGTFGIRTSSGPASLSRSTADTVTISDSLVRSALGFARTTADTVAVSDSVARIAADPRTTADTVTVSDSLVRSALTRARSTADTVAVSDSLTRAFAAPRTTADTITVSDSLVGVPSTARTTADTVTVSDSLTRAALSRARATSDTVTISDSLSGVGARARTTADTVTVSDAVARALSDPRTTADTVTVSDSVTRTSTRPRTTADTVAVSDAVSRAVTEPRTTSDTITVSDAVARVVAEPRTTADTVSVSDSVARGGAGIKSTADTVAVSDSLARAAIGRTRTTSDTVAVSDSLLGSKARSAATADTLVVIDSLSRASAGSRGTSDTVTITDSLQRLSPPPPADHFLPAGLGLARPLYLGGPLPSRLAA
jgi:hypothetical protein